MPEGGFDSAIRARCKPEISVTRNDLRIWILASNRFARPVRRTVIDDDNMNVQIPAFNSRQTSQTLQSYFAPVKTRENDFNPNFLFVYWHY
jgi:hypothetical protein